MPRSASKFLQKAIQTCIQNGMKRTHFSHLLSEPHLFVFCMLNMLFLRSKSSLENVQTFIPILQLRLWGLKCLPGIPREFPGEPRAEASQRPPGTPPRRSPGASQESPEVFKSLSRSHPKRPRKLSILRSISSSSVYLERRRTQLQVATMKLSRLTMSLRRWKIVTFRS